MSRRGDRRARVGAGRHDRLDAEHVGGSPSSHLCAVSMRKTRMTAIAPGTTRARTLGVP
jgi:hypothetical protein